MQIIELFKKLIESKSETPDDGGLLDFIEEYLSEFTAIRVDVEDVKNLFIYKKFGEGDHLCFAGITFFNPFNEHLNYDAKYVPSEDGVFRKNLKIRGNAPGQALYYHDVGLSVISPSGAESKGYFVITSFENSALPQVAAKTYNLDVSGATFGQSLFAFRASDLITEGFRGFIAGIAISPNRDTGFRTNLGLLNTDEAAWAELRLTVLNEEGVVTGEIVDLWLEPGELKQFNIADRLNLPAVDMDASVVIEVLSGGPVGGYASTIDNRTQDPILIPAVPDIHQFSQ